MNFDFGKIAITGDIHGIGFKRIKDAKKLGFDTLIVCGDFGYIWSNIKENKYNIRVIGEIGINILFLDGNHENFDELKKYPYENMFEGRVQIISKNIIHLLRGETYRINNRNILVIGGAVSTDKDSRIEGKSWWKEEVPNEFERENAMNNLKKLNYKVDMILSHTAPSSVLKMLNAEYRCDEFTQFLETIDRDTCFKTWYFGHMHINKKIDEKHMCIYDNIIDFS